MDHRKTSIMVHASSAMAHESRNQRRFRKARIALATYGETTSLSRSATILDNSSTPVFLWNIQSSQAATPEILPLSQKPPFVPRWPLTHVRATEPGAEARSHFHRR